jgi:hypothetical protein
VPAQVLNSRMSAFSALLLTGGEAFQKIATLEDEPAPIVTTSSGLPPAVAQLAGVPAQAAPQQQEMTSSPGQAHQQPTGGLGSGGPGGAASAFGPPVLAGKMGNGPGSGASFGNTSGGLKVGSQLVNRVINGDLMSIIDGFGDL